MEPSPNDSPAPDAAWRLVGPLRRRFEPADAAPPTSAPSRSHLRPPLFGHVRGSFTGATQTRRGLFVEANSAGTGLGNSRSWNHTRRPCGLVPLWDHTRRPCGLVLLVGYKAMRARAGC